MEADVRHRVNKGCKVLGALKGVMKNRGLGMNVNPSVPVLIYSDMSENVQSFKRKREREREREKIKEREKESKRERDREWIDLMLYAKER